MKIVHKH